jgi:hypothetical protein
MSRWTGRQPIVWHLRVSGEFFRLQELHFTLYYPHCLLE